ncbi:MAG: hypothetical protein ACHWZW_21955 [Spirulina sp.]
MSAFSTTDLPPSVDSLEKLVVWACGAFYQLHKNDRYQESDASPLIPLVTAQDGLAADKTERIIFRLSIQLLDTWREDTLPMFAQALEASNAAIPSGYTP